MEELIQKTRTVWVAAVAFFTVLVLLYVFVPYSMGYGEERVTIIKNVIHGYIHLEKW